MNKFTVPKPCHENWENMLPEEKGRFCTSCKTKVYDFSESSNEQIQEIYDSENGYICGRFGKEQLINFSKFQKRVVWFENFTHNHFSNFGIIVSAAALLMNISGCTKKTEGMNSTAILSNDSLDLQMDSLQNNATLGKVMTPRTDSAQITKANIKERDAIEKTVQVNADKPKNNTVKPSKELKDINDVPPRIIDHSQGFPLGKIAPVKTDPPKEVSPQIMGKPMRVNK